MRTRCTASPMESLDQSTHVEGHSLPAPDERLQLALDAGAIAGTWFWDVVADRFTSDRRFAQCFRLDEARMEAGVRLAEVVQSIHPDDEPQVKRLIQHALNVGGAYRAEYRVCDAQGIYRWIEANGKVTLAPDGSALTFPGVLVDIDLRKQAERRQAALIQLGDQLRGLNTVEEITAATGSICGLSMGATRAGYGVVDEVQGLVDIRPEWRRDADTKSVAGVHRFRDFGSFIEDLRQGEVVAIADIESDPRTAPQAQAFHSIGITALLNVPLMRDGQFKGVLLVHDAKPRTWTAEEISFAHGVADRTWAAMATADALAQLRALNNSLEREVQHRTADRNRLWQLSTDMIMIARFDGEITATNPAWSDALGWAECELVGRSFFELIHPEDRLGAIAAADAMKAGGALPQLENRYRHKNGDYRWISWSSTADDGLIFAAGRDVSAAKALQLAEEKLRQSQKMEAVGQLTGGVAHDFNNLLTVISTSAALLRRKTTSEERRERAIDAIARTVTRAARLTGQLLAFARRQALTPAVFDAADNVKAILEMIGTLVGARIEVCTTMEDGCFIDADPGQFDTAIVNMAVNARDAMEGSGKLSVTVQRLSQLPGLRLHPAAQGDHVAVSVVDTGCGISQENLERIFEPFYTTKPVGQGTGLGLSQVFGFVKQSGGDVDVRSELGKGTSFTLYFPLAQTALKQAAELTPRPDLPAVLGGTVLIIEDNPEVAHAVDATFKELGYSTVLATEATKALRELEHDHTRFAAVFSDVVMAGMDGIALGREIQRRWPKLPVVLTSGYSHVVLEQADHGFQLLAKPYDVAMLAQTMHAAIPTKPRGLPVVLQSILDDAQAETQRQAELDSMNVLDTAPEAAFDDLVRMAADICETPVALVSLIDRDRQWFKAKVGVQATETPREHAFCAHAIQQPDQVTVVEDATKDQRFAANPLVTGDPNIRFYAGAPLLSSAGHALGTLCVIAPLSRRLETSQMEMLQLLADEVVKRLEQRRARLQQL